ncbi:hypothetical protein HDU97_010220 [Phlyctochytrium planicorne]|nr:hypothetical protein HDU97_010220 [Phlyctochytrium planicorne]
MLLHTILAILCIHPSLIAASTSSSLSTKGITSQNKHLYEKTSTNQFECHDKSRTIPYSSVNDDYCECADGSDEPGTSACSNGRFHCENIGHAPDSIPSSRVNDGICDPECCDGTDEYDGKVACPNRCEEAGRRAKEEFNKVKSVRMEGARLRRRYVKQNRWDQKNKAEKAESLKAEVEVLDNEVEELRDQAETNLRQLKDKQQYDSPALSEKLHKYLLDHMMLTTSLVGAVEGLVTTIQAKKDAAGWIEKVKEEVENVKGWTMEEVTLVTAKEIEEADAANKAREQYDTFNKDLIAKKQELESLGKTAAMDLGPDGSFGMLEGCLEYDTPEYIYEVCFFDKAEQKSKNGGSVNLGSWASFTGKDLTQFSGKNLKYTEAKFEGGVQCWNGPARSLTISFECGLENKILSFTEPNKCEYAARVTVPAVCEWEEEDKEDKEEVKKDEGGKGHGHGHDEL